MMKQKISILFCAAVVLFFASCGKNKSSSGATKDPQGQLIGAAPPGKWMPRKPFGMVHIPKGTFQMGNSDEDINYSLTSRSRQVSIDGFWMDATEITNNEYRQFTNYVRDSIALSKLGFKKSDKSGNEYLDWTKLKTIKWGDRTTIEKLEDLLISPDQRINGKLELDAKRMIYQQEYFDYKEASKRENAEKPRSLFLIKDTVPIYPDTLVWVRDFAYAYNEPMSKQYYAHPAFGNYPVVGVNWKQATAFCVWRSKFQNDWLQTKGRAQEADFRLPTEAQWEYGARGGRSQAPYPWGGPYTRNQKGCLMANFKPGRGNYPEDGGMYTVRADAYWPNDFGLYCMAGNVSEWTSSIYYEGSYVFMHDMNPDVRWNAKRSDPPRMKRKVIRGGSWKDVAYLLQNGTRAYEYQDTAKSYIGFRTVIDLPPLSKGK